MKALLAILLLQAAPQERDVNRVVLRDSVTVPGRYVRLMDLVAVEALRPETRRALADVWIGRSPEKGAIRTIPVAEIRLELELRGVALPDLVFHGESVKVRRGDERTVRAEKRMRRWIRADLDRQFAVLHPGASMPAVHVTYLATSEFSDKTELVSVKPRQRLRVGKVLFQAVVRDGEKGKDHTFDGIARINRVIRVAFAARNLKYFHRILPEDVVMKRLEVETAEGYCSNLDLLVGSRVLKEGMKAGEVFLSGRVKWKAIVLRKKPVEVTSRFMKAHGKALSNGGLGDIVRVEFPVTKKIVTCRVTGPDRVAILEDPR